MLDEQVIREKYRAKLMDFPEQLSVASDTFMLDLLMEAVSEGWNAAVMQFRRDLADWPEIGSGTHGDAEVCRYVTVIQLRSRLCAVEELQTLLIKHVEDMKCEMEWV
jgi:hypothetical protein